MSPTKQTPILGVLPAPHWHRPHFRYFAPVDGAEGATPTDPPAEPAPAAPADPPAEPATPDPAAADTPPWGEDFDPERAWKRIQAQKSDLEAERSKRDKAVKDAEAAAEKRAKEAAYREFGKQLGLVEDDKTPTVDSLTATLQERDSTLSQAQAALSAERAENAVLRFAGKHNADSDALLDSRDFTEKLAGIDPTTDTYASEVETLIKSTVESNSRYRKVQVAPRSSNGDPAPSGGDNTPKDDIESLRAAYRKERGVTD